MRKALIAVAMTAVFGCTPQQDVAQKTDSQNMTVASKITYPETKKGPVVDEYFGTSVADPYRWLEDDLSAETAQWVSAQNTVTQDYLSQITYRDDIAKRMAVLMDYEKETTPFTEGKYTYFYRNDGLQNQAVLYRQGADGEAEVFLDPNTFSADGTTSMSGVSFSKDGSLVAYQLSEGGSDWRSIVVRNVETGEEVETALENVKFSGIAWLGNQGFYYSSYDKPEGSDLSAKTDQHKLYYHALGTPQAEDKVIFGATDAEKHRYVSAGVTDDEHYLAVYASVSTSGNKLFIKDLTQADAPFVTVLGDVSSDSYIIDNQGSTLFIETNLDAPNKRVVKVDASAPTPDNWVDVIPQTDNVLDVTTGAGYLFANYMVDALTQVKQYSYSGELVREIPLPGLGTAYGFDGKNDAEVLYYDFTNYSTPNTSFAFNPQTGESTVYRESASPFNSADYTSEQVFYTSKDGTKVPMIITYKKGLEKNGANPTMLYGYGGFNVSLRPRFSNSVAQWLELGGVFAVPNLRGGGEYGKEWHDAGTQLKKQNVFDDFIAAAEFLIAEQFTTPDKLAIRGGSNGGLLVGATMTQRPELFQVALPAVGVMDMLRYHTFTAGAGWAYDYGTSEQSKEMFEYLLGYSPVHNVKAGVDYPATMVTTADHDDRVVPAHSFKFAAELQDKHVGSDPVFIRIDTNAGHGAGTPTSMVIDQYADIYAFTLYNMGITSLEK